MLKQYTMIIGLGLTLGLAGCAQTNKDLPSSEQVITESPDIAKTEEGQRRRGNRDGQRRTPPAEAYAACASLALESACSFESPRGTRAGVCRVRPNDDRAICAVPRPEGGRRRRGGQ